MFTFFGDKVYSKDDIDHPLYKETPTTPIIHGKSATLTLDDFHLELKISVKGIDDINDVEGHEYLLGAKWYMPLIMRG